MGRSAIVAAPDPQRLFQSRRLAFCASAVSIALVAGAFAGCGGTTGRDDAPSPAVDLSSASVDAGTDATLNDAAKEEPVDAGFDVDIQYADAARLPHFAPMPEGGAEAGVAPWDLWPACTPDGINPATGDVILDDAGMELLFDGVTTPDGSSPVVDYEGQCATFVWTTSAACDQCIRLFQYDDPTADQYFPPCSDLTRDASAPNALAAGGPGKGALKFQLCAQMYLCILNYFSSNPSDQLYIDAFCGRGNSTQNCEFGDASGPCQGIMEEALESTDKQAIVNGTTLQTQGTPGNEGREVNRLLQSVISEGSACIGICFGDAGATPSH